MFFNLKSISTYSFDEADTTQNQPVNPPIVVRDRTTYANPGSVATKILNALEERAKKFERKEMPEDAISLVTIDQFVNVIGSPTQVQDALDRILDLRGKGKDRIAFFSPFIINDKGKTALKLALIHPPLRNNLRDARKLYEKCIETSIEYASRIFENRKKNTINLSVAPQKFDPYFFSYASEFKRFVDKVFDFHKLQRLDTNDFEKKVLLGLAEKGLLSKVSPNYFIVNQDAGQDSEVKAHLTYLKSGLADASLTQEQKYELQDIINQLELNTDKIDDQKYKMKLEALKKDLINRMVDLAKNPDKRDLMWINFEKELQEIQYPKIEDAEILRGEMFNELGGVSYINKEGLIVGCFVHPHYFSLVESHITRLSVTQPEYRKKLEWLKKIKEKIQSIPALDDEFDRRIPNEQRLELAKEIATFKYQLDVKQSKEKFDEKYESSRGYAAIFISILVLGLLGSIAGPFAVMAGLVPAGVLVWLAFRKNDPNKKQVVTEQKISEPVSPTAVESKNENLKEDKTIYYSKLSAVLEKNLFPEGKKFDTVFDKCFTDKTIKSNLTRIVKDAKLSVDMSNPDKVFGEVDRAFSTQYVKIRLPENLVPEDGPNYYYIPKTDWEVSKKRGQKSLLVETFAELKKKHNPSSLQFKVFDHLENATVLYHTPEYAKKYIVDKTKKSR